MKDACSKGHPYTYSHESDRDKRCHTCRRKSQREYHRRQTIARGGTLRPEWWHEDRVLTPSDVPNLPWLDALVEVLYLR